MDSFVKYPKVAQLKSTAALRARYAELGLSLPIDDQCLSATAGSPLAAEIDVGGFQVANRWCIQPMEGWDANRGGNPTAHTLRRWRRFGLSGAKLIWGGEAAAVRPSGRANPHQILATETNRSGLSDLLAALQAAHREKTGSLDGLLVGLQLTHSGRFSKPNDHRRPEPRIAYHHPLLDPLAGIAPDDPSVVWTDEELDELIDDFVSSARLAYEVGFQLVDIKACHGYLLHEFLSARHRPGPFGGDLAGRSRLLMKIVRQVRAAVPQLRVGVRISVFDIVPYCNQGEGAQPMAFDTLLPYELGFGTDQDKPLEYDLSEPRKLIGQLVDAGVAAINLSCGCPYYNPHIVRPAIFPPSDGYPPPEDPLASVWRQIDVVRQCKSVAGHVPLVGSGYSYLQDYLPHVAQAVVRSGWVDLVGLGRMVLSYPELPHDVLTAGTLNRKRVCRTFSDCTTAPRHGMVSGCFPLDDYYKQLPDAEQLIQIKLSRRNL